MSRSRSPAKRASPSRDADRNRNWDTATEKIVDRDAHYVTGNRDERDSWSPQWTPSWSRSRSKTPPVQQGDMVARDWSPPANVLNDVPPKNLTVILTNKEAIKKKKKEKRKDAKKVKESDKRSRRTRRPRNGEFGENLEFVDKSRNRCLCLQLLYRRRRSSPAATTSW